MHAYVLVVGHNVEEAMAPFNLETEVEPYPVEVSDADLVTLEDVCTEDGTSLSALTPNKLADLLAEYFGAKSGKREGEAYYYLTSENPRGRWDWYQPAKKSLKLKAPTSRLFGLVKQALVHRAQVRDVDLAHLRENPPFALVVGGEWHEDESAKWDAEAAAIVPGAGWKTQFRALTSHLDQEEWLTMLDYHS